MPRRLRLNAMRAGSVPATPAAASIPPAGTPCGSDRGGSYVSGTAVRPQATSPSNGALLLSTVTIALTRLGRRSAAIHPRHAAVGVRQDNRRPDAIEQLDGTLAHCSLCSAMLRGNPDSLATNCRPSSSPSSPVLRGVAGGRGRVAEDVRQVGAAAVAGEVVTEGIGMHRHAAVRRTVHHIGAVAFADEVVHPSRTAANRPSCGRPARALRARARSDTGGALRPA